MDRAPHTVLDEPLDEPLDPPPGRPRPSAVVRYRLFARFAARPWLRRLLPGSGLTLDADGLRVRLGPWAVETPLANLAGATVTGPFTAIRALGPRLSLADHGLTLGTTTARGLCVRFHDPVRGLDPFGRLRHPALTVTVDGPDLVADAINHIAAGRRDG